MLGRGQIVNNARVPGLPGLPRVLLSPPHNLQPRGLSRFHVKPAVSQPGVLFKAAELGAGISLLPKQNTFL